MAIACNDAERTADRMSAGARKRCGIAMVPTKAPLFELLSARMRWLGERQVVLGQNIANADTPDYRPKDLHDDAFARLVRGSAGTPARLPLQVSDAAHLAASRGARLDPSAWEQDRTFEIPRAHYQAVAEVIGYVLRLRDGTARARA